MPLAWKGSAAIVGGGAPRCAESGVSAANKPANANENSERTAGRVFMNVIFAPESGCGFKTVCHSEQSEESSRRSEAGARCGHRSGFFALLRMTAKNRFKRILAEETIGTPPRTFRLISRRALR